ncbi:MAG: transcription termination factor Rho, partial [Actinobacteria bacterium]|nr:transcription termination factor Rho [Actinomycetota bacterium]
MSTEEQTEQITVPSTPAVETAAAPAAKPEKPEKPEKPARASRAKTARVKDAGTPAAESAGAQPAEAPAAEKTAGSPPAAAPAADKPVEAAAPTAAAAPAVSPATAPPAAAPPASPAAPAGGEAPAAPGADQAQPAPTGAATAPAPETEAPAEVKPAGDRPQQQGGQQQGQQQGGGQQQRQGKKGRRGRDKQRQGGGDQQRDDRPTIPCTGILDVLPDGFGFLRTSGFSQGDHDVYVSLSQIRRFGLRRGDEVAGQVREPKDNEKYNALLKIDTVNGIDPDTARKRPVFEQLTPLFPEQRLRLETEEHDKAARIMDLMCPIGKGQRGLITSPPKAGKTTILKKLANSIATNNPEVDLFVLLVDERPEEV